MNKTAETDEMAFMPGAILTKEREQFSRLALELGETLEYVWNMAPQERWEQSSYTPSQCPDLVALARPIFSRPGRSQGLLYL